MSPADVTKHRTVRTGAKYRFWVLVKCVWCSAYYWFRLRKVTGYGFHAFLTCMLLLLLLIQCKISMYWGPVRCFVTPVSSCTEEPLWWDAGRWWCQEFLSQGWQWGNLCMFIFHQEAGSSWRLTSGSDKYWSNSAFTLVPSSDVPSAAVDVIFHNSKVVPNAAVCLWRHD